MNAREQEESDRLSADPEPRAREVVSSEGAPIFDVAARWETALTPQVALSLPLYVATTMPSHLDPADWGAGFLAVHERELPPQLFADLREVTPQALLRDLHRPVEEFRATPLELEGTRLVGRWTEGVEDLKKAKERQVLPLIESSLFDVQAEQVRRRALVEEDWKPLLDDEAPRKSIQLYPNEREDE